MKKTEREMAEWLPSPAIIGIFDSGLGGLSVLKSIHETLPDNPIVYLADQAHVPYGPRPMEEVCKFSVGITRWLLSQGSQIIVAACNTASAAALYQLRKEFPETPFVGMEPAVKPAAQNTLSGVVGVLATPATFQGEMYASVLERFANNVTVLQDTCPGLVAQVEAGEVDSPAARQILVEALLPMMAQGLDTVVLGCTHYPFVIPLIQEIVGPEVRVIDPAPAIARQTARLIEARQTKGAVFPKQKQLRFVTTGNPLLFQQRINKLTGLDGSIESAWWNGQETDIEQVKPI
jgi:glutamate racemase